MIPVGAGAVERQQLLPEASDNLNLIIRCYDAVIQDLVQAKELQMSQQVEATYDKIRHAQDIITELLVSLDYERGGPIAQNLSRIYNFVLRQLIGVNSSQNTDTYDHLVHMLADLKGAWLQIRPAAVAVNC